MLTFRLAGSLVTQLTGRHTWRCVSYTANSTARDDLMSHQENYIINVHPEHNCVALVVSHLPLCLQVASRLVKASSDLSLEFSGSGKIMGFIRQLFLFGSGT